MKKGIVLALFSAILTGLLTLVHILTKPIIDKEINRQQQALFNQVISSDLYDNDLQKSCYIVQEQKLGKGEHRIYIARRGKIPTGAIVEITAPDGYSGSIRMLVGSDFSGTILGTRVIEHHETPGLGDKIELRLSKWILKFNCRIVHGNDDLSFIVKKDGGEFDQLTGATITSRAVVNAVKRAGLYAKSLITQQLSTLESCRN